MFRSGCKTRISLGWRLFLHALLDICFPPDCLGCGARLPHSEPPLFCPACRERIFFLPRPLCLCCGKPFLAATGDDHLCAACLSGSRSFSKARAVALYKGPVARAIHSFKYGGRTVGLASFAALKSMAGPVADLDTPDYILPVPLHPARLRQRGFNQALLLARAFFPDQRALILVSALERHRRTAPQTGMTGKERRRNMKNAFLVSKRGLIKGKKVLLVDDVFTTGTTVNECARVLRRAGAGDVQALTLARVQE